MIFRSSLMHDNFVHLSSTSPAHLVLQVLLAHRDLLALLGLK